MGTEYRQFLVVDDAHWRPQSDTAQRVEAVLRHWLLIVDVAEIVDLACGDSHHASAASSPTASAPGAGVAIVYSGAQGPAVEVVAGPSAYPGIDPAERYLKRATLVIGDDYRVQWGTDGVYFELLSPPLADGVPIPGNDEHLYDALFAASFPSAKATSAPVVSAQLAEYAKTSKAWDTCLGYWRGALVIDFGKDLPAFSEQVQALPSRDFVSALSAALRGPLVEIGDFY